jgi:hypothetical protein
MTEIINDFPMNHFDTVFEKVLETVSETVSESVSESVSEPEIVSETGFEPSQLNNSDTVSQTVSESVSEKNISRIERKFWESYGKIYSDLHNIDPENPDNSYKAEKVCYIFRLLFIEVKNLVDKLSNVEFDERNTYGRQISLKIGSISMMISVDLEFSGPHFSHGEIYPTYYKSYDVKPQTITVNIKSPYSFEKQIGYTSRYFARDQQLYYKNGFSPICEEINRISAIYSKGSTMLETFKPSWGPFSFICF